MIGTIKNPSVSFQKSSENGLEGEEVEMQGGLKVGN